MLSSAPMSGLLPSCRRRSLPLPHLPSRRLRKPRAPLALLSPAPVFFLCWVLATTPGGSVSPGQSEYFLDVSCFTFSLHPPHFPAPQSCLHHPGGSPSPPPREGPAWAPTHTQRACVPPPSWEGLYTPPLPGLGPFSKGPQEKGGEGPPVCPTPSLSRGQGQGEGTRPSCSPWSPACLRQTLAWHPAS